MRPGVRDTNNRRAPVTMNDERMSDHDEETKSRLRWTEARRAGGHAFLAPSRVDSTSPQAHGVLIVVLVFVVLVI